MKRFFLYFLLLLLFVGLATLVFGFYRAKNIRSWAKSAGDLMWSNDVGAKERDAQARFDASGGKNLADMKNEFVSFSAELDTISQESKNAKEKIMRSGGSGVTRQAQNDIADYYGRNEEQARNIGSVVKFMNQLFEVAVIFDRIKEDTTLDEIKGLINEAKGKGAEINADVLPDEMKASGADLKATTDSFLSIMQQTAEGTIDSTEDLNKSYADFSQKEDDFFSGAKKYVDSFENLEPKKQNIEKELLILNKVRFSLR